MVCCISFFCADNEPADSGAYDCKRKVVFSAVCRLKRCTDGSDWRPFYKYRGRQWKNRREEYEISDSGKLPYDIPA